MALPDLGDRLEADAELEQAALARPALDADAAIHHLDQALRDREPQPGTAVLPGGRGIGLGERTEHLVALFRGDADAGIAHRDRHLKLLAFVGNDPGGDLDLALVGGI